jgi:hypothetical protein
LICDWGDRVKLLRRILSAFRAPKPRKLGAQSQSRALRQIVAARSHGNIRLQQGKYVTKNELMLEFEAAREIKFQ